MGIAGLRADLRLDPPPNVGSQMMLDPLGRRMQVVRRQVGVAAEPRLPEPVRPHHHRGLLPAPRREPPAATVGHDPTRDRRMIARALAGRPRVLMLDEATSALDNKTQSVVTESVQKLSLTRITIAHRLSTIVAVDRVIVLDRGAVVQDGAFNDLLTSEGLFRELARRQLK